MRIKYKTRKTLTQIGSILMVCLIAFGAIMGAVAISKKLNEDTMVIHPQFEVGGLNSVGEYDDTDKTIYTKESFECLGLEVKLDFDSNVKYQAYFYDDLDKFVSCSAVYDESMALTVPANVTHARLVVEPIWDDEVESEDRVCHWYNVYKYANQLEISVLKDQKLPEFENVALWEDLADYDLATLASADVHRISPLSLEYASFVYSENHFENTTVSKIGIPVDAISNPSADNNFTVYVIKEASTYTSVNIVDEYVLTIKADEYSSSSLDKWVYFDVNIPVGDGETLMFGTTTDTIVPHYDREGNECGTLIWKANTANATVFSSTGSLLFDIYVAEEK